ncbi:pitrilysin family protein [soil metagenome]
MNRHRSRFPYFLVILALFFTSFRTVTAQTTAAGADVSEFDVNGMKVLIKKRPGTPTVSAGLFFRGGVRNTTADNAGIEGLTLSVATEASKAFPRQKLRKETSRVGTVISSGSSFDYSVLALASTKTNFENSWRIFVDVALNPSFEAEDVSRVKETILTGLRSQTDSPESSLELLNQKVLFAGHPYANDPSGTIASITKLKAADLAAYHRKLMQTSRLLLVIVGDVEPAALQKQIAASFSGLPKGDYKDAALPALNFVKPSVDITTKTVQTDYVKGTFAAPSIKDPDYYAMRAAITILQTAVFEEVRTKRNLSYAPDASLDERSANTGSISVTSVDPNQSIKIMLGEIQNLRQNPIEEDQIGRMAGYFLTTYYLGQETSAAQAKELAQYELIGGGWRNSLQFLDRIRKVKPEEIQAVANKYMKNLRFVVVGNPADIDKSIFLQN